MTSRTHTQVLESMPNAFVELDSQWRFVYVDRGAEQFAALRVAEMLVRTPWEVFAEIDGYTLPKRWIRKNGDLVHACVSVKCLRCADGSVESFVALLQDLTEHNSTRNRLREREEQYRTLFNSIDEGFCVIELLFDKS